MSDSPASSEGVRATTRERRDEWKRLAEAATEGPWDLDMNKRWGSWKVTAPPSDGHPDYSRKIADSLLTEADAEFIAAAREAVPALIAEVESLSVERDDLRAKLKLVGATLDEVAGVLNDTEAERDYLAAKITAVEAENDNARAKEALLRGVLDNLLKDLYDTSRRTGNRGMGYLHLRWASFVTERDLGPRRALSGGGQG